MDLEDLDYVLSTMKLLGSKGTTGTQASFLELFDGDQDKLSELCNNIDQFFLNQLKSLSHNDNIRVVPYRNTGFFSGAF